MFKILFFVVFIPVTIILIGAFINGLFEDYQEEQEARKSLIGDGIIGFLDQTFGYGTAKIFKTVFDSDGILRYIVYRPQYEWFKSAKYQWYEVYETNNNYNYNEIER